jgi:hypothetical protein
MIKKTEVARRGRPVFERKYARAAVWSRSGRGVHIIRHKKGSLAEPATLISERPTDLGTPSAYLKTDISSEHGL